MTDIDELRERLESSSKAFRENTVYTSDGDPVRLTVQADEMTKASAALASLQEQVQRLEQRLEVVPGFSESADGISCRDDTIKLQDEHIASLQAQLAAKDAVLAWYAEQAAGCRKATSAGNEARYALDQDGGKRARAALGQGEGIASALTATNGPEASE